MRFSIKQLPGETKKEKLSLRDKKLLQLLIQEGRMSVSELSKEVGISKPAISKKITSLKERGIILDYVVYNNAKIEDPPMYLIEISTSIGMENPEISKEILNLNGVSLTLWYNGVYNLFVAIFHKNPSEVIEEIDKIVPIKKLRLKKIINNYFHPPQLFKEIPDKKAIISNNNSTIDEMDRRIIEFLSTNPRATLLEISEKINLSNSTIKKRLERLKKEKIIIGISAFPNPWICNRDIVSISFMIKGHQNKKKVISKILNFKHCGNVWEFDHEWNINAVFWVENQKEINDILKEIYKSCEGIIETEIQVLVAINGK